MNALTWPTPWPRWTRPWSELRVDVHLPEDKVAAELARLNARREVLLAQATEPGGGLRLPPDLRAHVREAHGEYFIYVSDRCSAQIVAYVTLNRLTDLPRRDAAEFRSPHTKVALYHRRRGIASAIYRWWLGSGRSLMTGARQSPAARGLWLHMALDHELRYVALDRQRVHDLGRQAPGTVLDQLNTRAVLLGRGCTLA